MSIALRKTKGFKASLYLSKVLDHYYPSLRDATLSRIIARLAPARHSIDFRSVRWFGASYKFTPGQAAIVAILWQAWENGTPIVGAAALLEATDMISDRISQLFRRCPAWGVMIQTDGDGSYWLSELELSQ